MRKTVLVLIAVVALVVLSGCTAGPNTAAVSGGDAAGFWQGLWHGIIAPITFVISLFNSDVSIYEIANNGGWYDFGFLFGLTAIWGGSGAASRRKKR